MTSPRQLVIDTNIVLDLFVFADEQAGRLLHALEGGGLCWLATPAMRQELERVLGYAQIVPRLAHYRLQAGQVLDRFDGHARLVEPPSKAPVTCSDPDDQKFIDLAFAHRTFLLSKDRAVLAMARRLAAHAVLVRSTLPAEAAALP